MRSQICHLPLYLENLNNNANIKHLRSAILEGPTKDACLMLIESLAKVRFRQVSLERHHNGSEQYEFPQEVGSTKIFISYT